MHCDIDDSQEKTRGATHQPHCTPDQCSITAVCSRAKVVFPPTLAVRCYVHSKQPHANRPAVKLSVCGQSRPDRIPVTYKHVQGRERTS